jgi:hypothetical protein
MRASIRFRPLRVSDFYNIELQPRHAQAKPIFQANPLVLHALTDSPFSFTMEVDGKPLAALGPTETREIWAYLGHDLKRHMVRLVRYTRAMLEMYGRCWARVDRNNPEGERFMLLLGLRKVKMAEEGTMDTWVYDR